MPCLFGLGSLVILFEERGFDQSEYLGVSIYSHEDSGADWLVVPGIFFNAAVLQKEGILILSAQIEGVQSTLDVIKGGC
jgi:hypothetical protein